ncbi:MAG: KilA-N domain-containing protein [Bacteroidota bacterium]
MAEKIHIEGKEITVKVVNEQDYISLTDMSNWDNSENSRNRIANWMRLKNTLAFLGLWENKYNPAFKYFEFEAFKNQAGENSFAINPKQWIEGTQAVGIVSKKGRYGGTFAHVDIAFEFATWLSPEFKFNLITEFKRLRSEEMQRQRLEWNAGRELARLNYPIQTAAIQEVSASLSEKKRGGVYAGNADMINKIVFGMTAKQWRVQNPNLKGNMRDYASATQNTIIGNLESFNSELIRKGASEEAREKALGEMAAFQVKILDQKYFPE